MEGKFRSAKIGRGHVMSRCSFGALPVASGNLAQLPHPTKYLEHRQRHSQCILSLSAAFTLSGWLDKKTGLDEADATNDEGRVRPIVLQ